MLQQRIEGHPDVAGLSAASGLQTLRVVTLRVPGGDTELLAARLRLIANNGAHDNFDLGRSGNLVANQDLATGRIRDVVGKHPRRRSIVAVDRHPRTGRALIGYPVPGWPAVDTLVKTAAAAFDPLCTVGWDVALSPDGPLLIEGNVTWDTLMGESRMGELYERLAAVAERAAGRPWR